MIPRVKPRGMLFGKLLHTCPDQARESPRQGRGVVLLQMVIVSVQDFCHCSASCIQSWKGFIAAFWKASPLGQLAPAVKPGTDFSLNNIVDGEAVIGLGNLICSSHASIV